MPPYLQFRLFGSFEISSRGQILPKPPTLKSQSLLAYLVFNRHLPPQRRENLSSLFWGDRPESKARGSLSTALWQIHRCLPDKDIILSYGDTVQIDPQADLWLDVENFSLLVSKDDIASVSAGVDLYRGDLLDGFYDDWIVDERYRLESLYCSALFRLMTAQETAGKDEAALITAKRLLHSDPLREDAHRVVMRTYCRLGQRNAALVQYKTCQDLVHGELGAEPMAETTELYRQILEGRIQTIPPTVSPSTAFSLPMTLAPLGRSPFDATALGRMVGRETEITFLQQCWKETEAGQGKIVFIRGDAGVGKTRLVEEFANRLRWQGFRILWGHCYEFERLLPYQPITEALRTVLPALSMGERANMPAWVLSTVSQLALEFKVEESNDDSLEDKVYDQAHLFGAVAQFLSNLSTHGPILVVLEDLHWSSESTLQLLHYLTSNLAGNQILVIGTSRNEATDQQHPLLEMREQLSRAGLATTINLHDLATKDIETMLIEMAGAGEEISPLARRLFEETEGNPFFIIETIKGLFHKGMVKLEGGKWVVELNNIGNIDLPLPESISEAIQARLRGLNENVQEALQLSAVLGGEFDYDLLETVWGQDHNTTLEALDSLLRQRLIVEGSGPTSRDYVFTHHKIQEVVYQAIPRRRRQQLHAQIAMALENSRAAQIDLFAGEIAHHFEQCQNLGLLYTQKAVFYLLRAGDRARFLYAFHDALNHYQRALALLKKVEQYDQAAQTLIKIGLTYHTALNFEQSRRAYDEGLALWQWSTKTQAPALSPAPHALRLSWREPETLDHAVAEFEWSYRVIDQLFCGLVDLTPESDLVPDVAYSWDVLDAGHRYVFHLRQDVKWSDGKPVTAGDFAFSWKRALLPIYNFSLTDLLEDIKGARAFHQGETSNPEDVAINVIDEITLTVELNKPNGYFLYLLPYLFPVPRHTIEAYGEAWAEPQNIVTNGPFLLDEWLPGKSMTLSRNPRYHGQFKGNVYQVELCLDPSMTVQLDKYEAEELDYFDIWTLPHLERDRARLRNADEFVSLPDLATFFIAFDINQPPFNNPSVRRAFAYATDRGNLANVIMRGCVAPATGGLIPPGMTAYSNGIALPYDPGKARQFLYEAGYGKRTGPGFPQVEAIVPRGALLPYVDSLRIQWKETLGVDIEWQVVELNAYPDRIKSRFPQMHLTGWMAECPDPGILLHPNRIQQTTHWRNARYADMVEKSGRTTSQNERLKLYQEADQILMEEAPIVPLTYSRSLLLVKPWVKKYSTSPITRWLWKDMVIEPH